MGQRGVLVPSQRPDAERRVPGTDETPHHGDPASTRGNAQAGPRSAALGLASSCRGRVSWVVALPQAIISEAVAVDPSRPPAKQGRTKAEEWQAQGNGIVAGERE